MRTAAGSLSVLLAVVAWLLPLAGLAQTTVKYVHTDALGSVVVMTDSTGAVIETTREYEPYGLQLTPIIEDGPGYTGHVQDAATGLTYMQQRYYDPQIGRFLSVDPVTAYSNGDMRFFTRYAYAANNPYKFTDPDGRFFTPETIWDAANVVIGAVSAYDNFSAGNIGAGFVDVGGVLVDGAATIIPGVPGGAGATIKAARGVDAVVDAARGADKGRVARPADGASMSTDEALDTAVSYLGDGYKQIDSGVYRSADGTRQVRMTDRDLNHPRQKPHMNFEEGQTVPNHRGTSTFEAEHNSHVYLPEK